MTGHRLEKSNMNVKRASFFAVLIGLANACVLSSPEVLAVGNTELIGAVGEFIGSPSAPVLSADGRFVTFWASASNLVPGDTNEVADVFVYDRLRRKTQRISVARDGTQGDNASTLPAISADGRFVAFQSKATNLVPVDTNNKQDVFVRNLQTGEMQRISLASNGSDANADSGAPSLSADGRFVAFGSSASNLVPGDTNEKPDVFVYDRQTKQTERVSVASDGTQGDSDSGGTNLSADGRFVAFYSFASNLVSGDNNRKIDVFVHDRKTGETERVSISTDGTEGSGNSFASAISADARYVAFDSESSNLVPGDTNGVADAFVYDRLRRKTQRISRASDGTQGNGNSGAAALSADGRYLAFVSIASNLVPRDTNDKADIFLHDRETAKTQRISVARNGVEANQGSFSPAISADGRNVAFESFATNLVPGRPAAGGIYALRDPLLDPSKKADLVVSQTTSVNPATAQGIGTASASSTTQKNITFTTTLRNNGPNKASKVTLIGLPPMNCGLRTVKPSQGRCSRAAISICRLGDLPAKKAITVKVTVNATAGRICRNIASVNAPPVDPKGGNNSTTKKVTVR